MVLWERPAGPAGGNGGCAGRVMYDGRHEPKDYLGAKISWHAYNGCRSSASRPPERRKRIHDK